MSGSLASQALVASASTPTAGVIVSEFPLNKHEIGGRPVHEKLFQMVFVGTSSLTLEVFKASGRLTVGGFSR